IDAAHRVERGAVEPLGAPGAEVAECDLGVGGLLRVVELRERVDARVGHLHRAEVRLARAEARGDVEPGERAEHGALAAAGIADQSDLHGARKLAHLAGPSRSLIARARAPAFARLRLAAPPDGLRSPSARCAKLAGRLRRPPSLPGLRSASPRCASADFVGLLAQMWSASVTHRSGCAKRARSSGARSIAPKRPVSIRSAIACPTA